VHSITNGVLSSSLATYGAGTSNKHIVIHPSGSFVYAVNFGSSNISIFTVQSNGLLSGPTNVTTPANPLGFVFEPGGKYAYGAGGLSTITTYSVDSTTGSLTAIGTTNSGTGSSSLSVGLFSTF
ncbi:MAG TPA: beta-propeller fold lactonase family protein, partial [Leptospiraceae bacterium]|nr:beta-propeller fold lactonase family protein [Leptospiraceae bacterium]